MKKEKIFFMAFVVVIIFMSCLNQISAQGKVYKTNLETGYITLQEKDIIEFGWNGQIHRIMIREINEDDQSIKITIFIQDAETPVYSAVSKKAYNKIDFDRDDDTDLILKLYDINDEDVTIQMEIPEKTTNPISINSEGIIITIGIIAIGLIIYFLFRKK